jgi:membrane protein implicated in regulation of membrane protease activity
MFRRRAQQIIGIPEQSHLALETDVAVHARVGTRLWLGDGSALSARGTILAVHHVGKRFAVGYRQRKAGSDGLLLVGGTAALVLTLLGAGISLPAWAQAGLFFGLAAAGYGLLRRWSLRSAEGGGLLPPPTDQAQVISAFTADGSGRVQWQGQSWAAHNVDPHTPLSPGERVTVMGREGNCLQVMARKSP